MMKKLTITTLMVLLTFLCFGQNKDENSDKQKQDDKHSGSSSQFFGLRYTIRWGETVKLYSDHSTKKIWSKKLKFKIVDEEGDTLFIRFRPITNDPISLKYKVIDGGDTESDTVKTITKIIKKDTTTENYKSNPNYNGFVNQNNSEELFYLLKKNKNSFAYNYQALTTGVLVLPIKIRFAVDSFPVQATPDVSIGPYFGYQWGKKAFISKKENTLSHTLATFVAPGLISVNSSNSTNPNDKNSTNFGLSCGFGYLFELNKFQIGAFTGYDFVFGDSSKKWVYQPFTNNKRPWLSIAIGFNFRKE